MTPSDRWLLVVRPRRITIICVISATVVLATMIVVGLLLRNSADGVSFRITDQVGLIGVGVVVAGGIMTGARPRLRVDASGLWVRNVLGEVFFDWAVIVRIAFPEGSHWTQLLLADDERYPVMAIQSLDKDRAVLALRRVRVLMAEHAPPPPVIAPEVLEAARLRQEAEWARQAQRPLGRLEEIDLQKAAKAAKSGRSARKHGRSESRSDTSQDSPAPGDRPAGPDPSAGPP
jgi:hypothetical protein